VNRRTGRLASSTNWLIDLAAVAVILGDNSGIAALLPRAKAEKLMRFNVLKAFSRHQKTTAGFLPTTPAHFRELASEALPLIAATFLSQEQIFSSKQVTGKRLISWILAEMHNSNSDLCIQLKQNGYPQLVCMSFGRLWWEGLLSKTKSKLISA